MKRYRFTEKRKTTLKTAFNVLIVAFYMFVGCSLESIVALVLD